MNPTLESRKILITEHPLPTEKIVHAHLDFPKTGELINNEKSLKIIGWALGNPNQKNPSIIIKKNKVETEYFPELLRPDVLDHLANGLGKGTPREKCGFSIEEELSEQIDILLKIDNKTYPWRQLREADTADKKIEAAIKAWDNFISNRLELITDDLCNTLKQASTEIVKNLIIGSTQNISSTEEVRKNTELSENEKEHLINFIEKSKKDTFCVDLLKSATENGKIKIPHPFKTGESISSNSYHYLGEKTLIRFTTNDNETFFLIQHVSSCDAIYFPRRKIIILDRHIHHGDVTQQIEALCKNFDSVIEKAKKENNFGGIIASHSRPYHFYYDILPAINILEKNQILHKIPKIITYPGGDFLPIKDLYNLSTPELILSQSEIEKSTKTENKFYIHTGIRYQGNSSIDKKNILDLDKRILEHSKKHITNNARNIINETKKCFPIIWFGITGQKRSWIEQAEACAILYNELIKEFPGLGIILDGWTSATTPTTRDQNETTKDMEIAKKIKEQTPPSAAIYSVIGETTQTKTAVASTIDLFIANHSTGSLHVARLANKPGISHLNKNMDKNDHIHYKTREIPQSEISEIDLESNSRPDFVSYAIPPRVVINIVKKVIDEENWYTNRASS